MPERTPTEEENKLAEQAAIAESKAKIAEAQLKLLQAQKGMAQANAPADPPTPEQEAASRAAIAESNKKAVVAYKDMVSGPEVKSLEGKITTEGTFIETRILAAQTLNKAMDSLVNAIKSSKPFSGKKLTILFHNPADFSVVQLYYSTIQQMEALAGKFEEGIQLVTATLNPIKTASLAGGAITAPLLAGYAVAGTLRSAIDVISLFKSNTSFSNFELTADETNWVASFAHAALKEHWQVYHPGMVPPGLIPPSAAGRFMRTWTNLKTLNETLAQQIQLLDEAVAAQQAALATVPPPDAATQQSINARIKELSTVKAQAQYMVPVYAQLEKLLLSSDATTNISVQSGIIRAEQLVQLLGEEDTYIIKLSVSSRGSNKISENLFRNARIYHSAGTAVSCLLFDKTGRILFAHNTSHYTPYKESGEIR